MLKIDKDLLKDINFEDLDFTLVDRYQKFLFLNVDDYSVAIALRLPVNIGNRIGRKSVG